MKIPKSKANFKTGKVVSLTGDMAKGGKWAFRNVKGRLW